MLTAVMVVALGALYTEPISKREVPQTITVDGQELTLTGAAGRRYTGVPVYALAHYALPGAGISGNVSQKLAHWQQSDSLRAVVFFGTVSVPARGMYYSWKKNLEDAGYTGPNWEPFYSSFTEDFTPESELRIVAYPGGLLRIEMNGKLLGEFNDEALSDAVWRACLGEKAELENRKDLVTLNDCAAPLASAADAAPGGASDPSAAPIKK